MPAPNVWKRRAAAGLLILLLLALIGWRVAVHVWPVRAVTLVGGLVHPWALDQLPDGRLIVTERPGRMRLIDAQGRLSGPLQGLPPVHEKDEGGLLDVAVAPDFDRSGLVYWTFSEPGVDGGPAATALARARLVDERLEGVSVIWRQSPAAGRDRHFGSRILFGPDGLLYLGLGDRNLRDAAQDPSAAVGKVLRLRPDGRPAEGNPFAAAGGPAAAVWSLGHRNVQGLAVDPRDGSLWSTDHGPQGGDELNRLQAGSNHGWPRVTTGCEYVTCEPIGRRDGPPEMTPPAHDFGTASVPLSSLTWVDSPDLPAWRGHWMAGTLWGAALVVIEPGDPGQSPRSVRRIRIPGTERLRDLMVDRDGRVLALAHLPEGRLVRLEAR